MLELVCDHAYLTWKLSKLLVCVLFLCVCLLLALVFVFSC